MSDTAAGQAACMKGGLYMLLIVVVIFLVVAVAICITSNKTCTHHIVSTLATHPGGGSSQCHSVRD